MLDDQNWERRFSEFAQAAQLYKLSDERREQLMAAFNEQRSSLLQRISASLSFDSLLQPLPQGARNGSADVETRQLFFACDLGDIALDIALAPESILLNGQLFMNEQVEPFDVSVMREEITIAQAQTDENDSFQLELEAGSADLLFLNDTYALMLKDVPLELSGG